MTEAPKTIFTDDEVASQVLKVIRDAKREVVLVTPYLDLFPWHHAQDALKQAADKGVTVRVLIRPRDSEAGEHKPSPDREKSVDWLLKNQIAVWEVTNLHAKIYLNEEYVVLSSMNLTESSTRNSRDIALLVRDPSDQKQIRDYVSEQLMSRATRLNPGTPVPSGQPLKKTRQPAVQASTGTCIRCGEAISRAPDRPLCGDCYDKWAEWENEDYEEKFCHLCGKPAETSYAKPLCQDCYRR